MTTTVGEQLLSHSSLTSGTIYELIGSLTSGGTTVVALPFYLELSADVSAQEETSDVPINVSVDVITLVTEADAITINTTSASVQMALTAEIT